MSVATELPLINVKFGLLVADPPVVPNVNVLVADIVLVNPPVPVYVKLVAFAIFNTVVAAVVCANTILFVPKVIERATAPVELNIPVVNVNPFNANVPLVNVVVPVAANVNVAPSEVVPEVLLIVRAPKVVLPLLVIVPVPTIVAVSVLNVPPLLNVSEFKFNTVVPGLNIVVPKLNVLK